MTYQTTAHFFQIAAAQWRMINLGTPSVGPLHTSNIGTIDEGLVSMSAIKSHP